MLCLKIEECEMIDDKRVDHDDHQNRTCEIISNKIATEALLFVVKN